MAGSARMARAWPCMASPLVVRRAWSAAPRHWHASALLDASSACPRPTLGRGRGSSPPAARARASLPRLWPVDHNNDSIYRF